MQSSIEFNEKERLMPSDEEKPAILKDPRRWDYLCLIVSILSVQPIYIALYIAAILLHVVLSPLMMVTGFQEFNVVSQLNDFFRWLAKKANKNPHILYFLPISCWAAKDQVKDEFEMFFINIVEAFDKFLTIVAYSFNVFLTLFYNTNLGFIFVVVNVPILLFGCFKILSTTMKAWYDTYEVLKSAKDDEYRNKLKSRIADVAGIWLDWLINVLAKGVSLGLILFNLVNLLTYVGAGPATSAVFASIGPIITVFSQSVLVFGALALLIFWGIRSIKAYYDKFALKKTKKAEGFVLNEAKNTGNIVNFDARKDRTIALDEEIFHAHKCGLTRDKRIKGFCINLLIGFCIIGANFVKFLKCVGIVVNFDAFWISALGLFGFALPFVIGLFIAQLVDQCFLLTAHFQGEKENVTKILNWKDSLLGALSKLAVGVPALAAIMFIFHSFINPIALSMVIACVIGYLVGAGILYVLNNMVNREEKKFSDAKKLFHPTPEDYKKVSVAKSPEVGMASNIQQTDTMLSLSPQQQNVNGASSSSTLTGNGDDSAQYSDYIWKIIQDTTGMKAEMILWMNSRQWLGEDNKSPQGVMENLSSNDIVELNQVARINAGKEADILGKLRALVDQKPEMVAHRIYKCTLWGYKYSGKNNSYGHQQVSITNAGNTPGFRTPQ